MAKTLREVGTYELVGRAPLQETERTPWACSDAFFYPCCWSNIAIELDYGLPRRCGKALRALSATRSVVRQCEAGVLDGVACTRGVYMK